MEWLLPSFKPKEVIYMKRNNDKLFLLQAIPSNWELVKSTELNGLEVEMYRDPATGEFFLVNVELLENGDVLRKMSKEEHERAKNLGIKLTNREISRKNRGDFIQMDLFKHESEIELSLLHRRYLVELIEFYNWEGEPLSYKGKLLTTASIQKIINLKKYDEANAIMNMFVARNYFRKDKHPDDKRQIVYYPTDSICIKGKLANPENKSAKLYQKKLSDVIKRIKESEKKAFNRRLENKKRSKKYRATSENDIPVRETKNKALGFLHMVIGYAQYETGLLVMNPHEQYIINGESFDEAVKRLKRQRKLKKMKFSDMALLYEKNEGVKPKNDTIKDYLEDLEKAGALFILRVYGNWTVVFHPDLIYRIDDDGQNEIIKTVRGFFEINKDE